jgi:hypothetical protein
MSVGFGVMLSLVFISVALAEAIRRKLERRYSKIWSDLGEPRLGRSLTSELKFLWFVYSGKTFRLQDRTMMACTIGIDVCAITFLYFLYFAQWSHTTTLADLLARVR